MSPLASRSTLAALIVTNVVLLVAVASSAMLSSAPKAQAAGIGGGNNISIVVGQATGSVPEMVYLVDVNNGKAAAVAFNMGTRKLEMLGARDLGKDLNEKDKGGHAADR